MEKEVDKLLELKHSINKLYNIMDLEKENYWVVEHFKLPTQNTVKQLSINNIYSEIVSNQNNPELKHLLIYVSVDIAKSIIEAKELVNNLLNNKN